MPVGRLLVAMRDAEEFGLAEVVAGELQPDRQAAAIEAAWDGKRRQPGERRRDSEDVVQIHLHRVVALRADGKGGRRRGRTDDHVALCESVGEIVRDEAAYFLRLQVIGVVV